MQNIDFSQGFTIQAILPDDLPKHTAQYFRNKIVAACKEAQKQGLGQFVAGRRGKPSRWLPSDQNFMVPNLATDAQVPEIKDPASSDKIIVYPVGMKWVCLLCIKDFTTAGPVQMYGFSTMEKALQRGQECLMNFYLRNNEESAALVLAQQ